MNKHFRLSDFSITYSTRTRADEIANRLSEFTKTLQNDDIVVIDFTGVEAISYSFLDQFFCNLNKLSLLQYNRISMGGWSDELLKVIKHSLEHRNCTYSQSDDALTLVCHSN